MWNPGDNAVLRGIVDGRVWLAQSVVVVKDTIEQTILLLLPGAQCAYPEGYFRWRHGDYSQGTRWQEAKSNAWKLRDVVWQTNRFLIFLEPEKYYATYYVWRHETDQFECYYINFQLPSQRSRCGFDTLDLELDVVVDSQFEWRWKDEEAYHEGIREGGIRREWADEIETAQEEVFTRIRERRYPLDGSWLDWRPNPTWDPPHLPERWMEA